MTVVIFSTSRSARVRPPGDLRALAGTLTGAVVIDARSAALVVCSCFLLLVRKHNGWRRGVAIFWVQLRRLAAERSEKLVSNQS